MTDKNKQGGGKGNDELAKDQRGGYRDNGKKSENTVSFDKPPPPPKKDR